MSNHNLIIFDTTMRDGEQSPGASMTRDEKLRIARQLERMRVDVIEAGFAAASNGDFEAVRSVAEAIRESTVCSLARANENDIRRAGEAIRPAARARIHTFIATSPIHMEKKLRMTPEEVVAQAVKAVGWAREYTDDVEFSAEDAGRSELDFLCRIFEAVIKAGAKTINVPDTVGYNVPEQYAATMRRLMMFRLEFCIRLLLLESLTGHQQSDHPADTRVVGRARVNQVAEGRTRHAVIACVQKAHRGRTIEIKIGRAFTREENAQEIIHDRRRIAPSIRRQLLLQQRDRITHVGPGVIGAVRRGRGGEE